MNDDTQPDLAKKLPQIPQSFPDLSRPTARATSIMCEVDGGAFVLAFSELRPVRPWTAADRFEGNSGYVEVGRFMLSPVAFAHLKKAILEAEAQHVKLFGELPDLGDFYRRLASELPDRKAEVEQRMGFRP